MVVDILLSTFNSEQFLGDLFFSLEQQSFANWRLIIRDDGSSDKTLGLLSRFKKENSERVLIIENNGLNLGPKGSFVELLNVSTAEYIMFCDHDDYWLPQKIEVSLKRIEEIEKLNPSKPALVCSDLTITDKDLKIIHSSFWKHSRINIHSVNNIYRLVINNVAVGCTVMINKKAKSIALPIPNQAVMHDWWIALKVAQNGAIGLIEESTILYRQHTNNAIGAKSFKNYSRLRLTHFTTTLKNNIEAYKMIKTLEPGFSIFKLLGYKISMTIYRISHS